MKSSDDVRAFAEKMYRGDDNETADLGWKIMELLEIECDYASAQNEIQKSSEHAFTPPLDRDDLPAAIQTLASEVQSTRGALVEYGVLSYMQSAFDLDMYDIIEILCIAGGHNVR